MVMYALQGFGKDGLDFSSLNNLMIDDMPPAEPEPEEVITPIFPEPFTKDRFAFTVERLTGDQYRMVKVLSADKRSIDIYPTTLPYVNVGTIGHLDCWRPHGKLPVYSSASLPNPYRLLDQGRRTRRVFDE